MKKYNLTINGTKYSVDINDIEDNKANIEVNGTPYTVELDMESIPTMQKSQPKVVRVAAPAPKAAPAAPAAVPAAPAAPTAGCVLKSPLPGTILDVFVNVGDTVKTGQHLILLEAMKMENNIDADRDGVVKEIRVRRSDSVMEGDVLLVIE
jgi:biotin carboxyl carrier protein